jgi:branched-subunit amino acid transport protein AzlD
MSAKEILRNMFNDYFVICTGITISQVIFCLIFDQDAFFSLTEMSSVIFSSAVFTLPHWIFWSKKELSKKQLIRRQVIHFFVLEILVVSCAHLIGWLEGFNLFEHMILMTFVLVVYIMVRLIGWRIDMSDSQLINERLAEFRKEDDGG